MSALASPFTSKSHYGIPYPCKYRSETPPFCHKLPIGHDYAAFKEELFHIAEAQAEPKVQPHRMADDLNRKSVILIFRDGRRCVHGATLTHCMGTQQVDNALEVAANGGLANTRAFRHNGT